MIKKFRVLALATALTLAFSALVASAATARPGTHKKGVTITIWDYFVNSPKERAALMTVANQWAKKTGNSVVNPGDVADSLTKYPLAAKGGQGPDVFQFPHDRLGSYAQPGLLAPPPASVKVDPSLYAPSRHAGRHLQGEDLRPADRSRDDVPLLQQGDGADAAEDVERARRDGEEAHVRRHVRAPLEPDRSLLQLRVHRGLRRLRLPADGEGLQLGTRRPRDAGRDPGPPADPGLGDHEQARAGHDELRHRGRRVLQR